MCAHLHHHCPSDRNRFQHGVEEGGQDPLDMSRVKTRKQATERQSAHGGEARPVCT